MSANEIKQLQEIIDDSKSIVFFGGAGVSTESGIPDFRSVDGLYNQKYDFPPEVILSHSFYVNHKQEFWKFYRDKLIITGVKPNVAHKKLAELEMSRKLKTVVTQNIDNLHQEAGSKRVLELHGSIHRNYCERCGKFFDLQYVAHSKGIPKCDECAGDIKPDVVLYEEPLNSDVMNSAINAISKCDTLIIGGTSLAVYPAAGLKDFFCGNNLVVINKDPLPSRLGATLTINDKIGEVFEQVKVR